MCKAKIASLAPLDLLSELQGRSEDEACAQGLPQDQVSALWCQGHQRTLNRVAVGTGETLVDVFVSLLSSGEISEEKEYD